MMCGGLGNTRRLPMTELKPPGPERDKEIAILRGEAEPKPWSTDISVAFELWEEMKGASRYVKLYISDVKKSGIYMFFEGKTDNEGWKITHVGKDEADAISGAYIKWKTKGG
jgi:hypothetical protein